MNSQRCLLAGLAASSVLLQPVSARALDGASVERVAPDRLVVRWQGADPVDVFVSDKPDSPLAGAGPVVRGDTLGTTTVERTDPRRPYFILKDERDGSLTRVAERLLPLEAGSNFRDVGGYPAAGDKHVRWGLIYRSGATPMLTVADYRYVGRLGIASDIDLRSTEERQIAPDQLPTRVGARYFAVDYPGAPLFSRAMSSLAPGGGAPASASPAAAPAANPYRTWLISLAPQYRDIFVQLLRGQGAVAYHCSAGQDRSGVATALVLSALGVPRDVILTDYHLSTKDRRPGNEMPKVDPAKYPGNLVAAFYAKVQAAGPPAPPRPLYDAAGVALLQQTFDEIEVHWGSVDNYLDKELGVTAKDIARLRALYLE